jgi:endonuclease YncB( thermonuclease family)
MTAKFLSLTVAALLLSPPLYATEALPDFTNKYAGIVTSVYDGDTVTMNVSVWANQTVEAKVRLKGIDTPEIRGKCPEEKELAIKAREFLKEMTLNKFTILEAIPYTGAPTGKFGRVIGTLYTPFNKNINQMLVDKGLARIYIGGIRRSWCG